MFLGPGLVMGASAIGGGEWLSGPLVSAKFGGSLFWLATLSILGQVVYNIEVSRYALYTGEPIFTGKFRTLPGPMFWLGIYLLLDLGSVLPYLASAGAAPLFAVIHHRIPDPKADPSSLFGMMLTDQQQIKILACFIFVSVFIPLTIGGKVYNSMKALMTFKLVTVFGFLIFIAVFYSTWGTWGEIVSGFFKFGNMPTGKDGNDPEVTNLFVSLWSGQGIPSINWAVIGVVASMAAISGNGGLTNAPMSNYTRDQGWGMGKHVGAIPSMVGGHAIELSHTGMVFEATPSAMQRWKGWIAHVTREQVCVWMPACFLGLALPSMLSVQFLRPKFLQGEGVTDPMAAAAATAEGVQNAVGGSFGPMFWYLTLFCGFLVLGTSMASTADGVLRRWVDVFWTALPWLRKWDTRHIGKLYFGVLCIYLVFGLLMLVLIPGKNLLTLATGIIYNYALGFSCLHVVAVNTFLLPRGVRPTLLRRGMLAAFGMFFLLVAVMATISDIPKLKAAIDEVRGVSTPK
jgi:hypothetical protein